jgi:hypothetical protein
MRENKAISVILWFKQPVKQAILLFVVAVMALTWLSPFMLHKANAAQITSRSLTLGTAVPSASTSYTFNFTTATSAFHLDAIKLIACTTAIGSYPGGTCTAPTGISFASATFGSISGFTDATNFTIDTSGANDCIATSHPEVLCLKRTSSSNDTAGAKTLVINAVTNPSSVNTSFYVGITTYNANTWPSGGRQDSGTTAAAIVQTLTVSAKVAEFLQFCVGSTATNDATTAPATSCSGIAGTTVNLGTLDSSAVTLSFSDSSSGGDNNNGVTMIRTNAANGATVAYDAVQAGSGTNHLGTLRITGASCNAGTVNTDGCINAAGTTQTAFTAGHESFGMTIAGVNCGAVDPTASYSCVYSSGTNNLQQQTNYVGGTNSTTFGASAAKGFAWQESGASTTIASSASSTIKQIDNEALILVFAASPAITTPFGSYTVQADFVATPTF